MNVALGPLAGYHPAAARPYRTTLEGDFKTAAAHIAFRRLMGSRWLPAAWTVLDDGTIPDRRGSLIVADEGTPIEAARR